MVNNPDDMGIYNPHIDEWVEIVHEAGGLCFYDHANFNGVMGEDPRRASSASTPACTCSTRRSARRRAAAARPSARTAAASELAPFLPAPVVVARRRALPARRTTGPTSVGKVREFSGNVPQVVKAYAWVARDGRRRASTRPSDLSVLANNYMEKRLLEIRGRHALAPAARRARGWR